MSISRNRRGSALLAVLWLSAALATIAFSLAATVRGEVERAATATDGVRSYELAAGAVQRAILHMLWGINNPGPLRDYAPGTPRLRFQFPTGDAEVEIVPESAKLNINSPPPEDLFRLLSILGVDPGRARAIVLAIMDWRAPSPEGLTEFDQYYLSLRPSFRSRHSSFEEIEELLLLRGMTPEIFYGTYERAPQKEGEGLRLAPRAGLAQCLSVFGSAGPVDVNTAHPAVLGAVGLPPDVVAALVARRRTAPLRPQDLAGLSDLGPAGARLRIGGNSIFTLRATARLKLANGRFSDMVRSVAAMVKFMPAGYDAPYHILRWYDRGGSGQL